MTRRRSTRRLRRTTRLSLPPGDRPPTSRRRLRGTARPPPSVLPGDIPRGLPRSATASTSAPRRWAHGAAPTSPASAAPCVGVTPSHPRVAVRAGGGRKATSALAPASARRVGMVSPLCSGRRAFTSRRREGDRPSRGPPGAPRPSSARRTRGRSPRRRRRGEAEASPSSSASSSAASGRSRAPRRERAREASAERDADADDPGGGTAGETRGGGDASRSRDPAPRRARGRAPPRASRGAAWRPDGRWIARGAETCEGARDPSEATGRVFKRGC